MRSIIFPLLLVSVAVSASPSTSSLSLLQTMREAEANSPALKVDEFRLKSSEETIRMKKSGYFPELSVAAIASTGDPGSFSMLDVDSNLSSTNRIGYGASLILKQDIWDFGRTSHSVESAKLENEVEKQQSSLTRAQVSRDVLVTYLDCAFYKTQVQQSSFMIDQAKRLAQEINHFVRSGQRSIIERYFVESELKSALTNQAEYSERMNVAEEHLGILLHQSSKEKVSCQDLEAVQKDVEWMEGLPNQNPLLERENLRLRVAESKLDEARAENNPRIIGMALAGTFDNDHLKDRDHYAAGVGVTWPLFSGFLVDAKNEKSHADVLAQQNFVEATRQKVDAANSGYDERIRSLRVRLSFLNEEKIHAKKVFELAHQRYEDMQGNITDLREAIKFTNKLALEGDQVLRDYLLAMGEKSLFNGFDIGKR
ncbi:MAG: TolC family protein [Bacillota bacterium]